METDIEIPADPVRHLLDVMRPDYDFTGADAVTRPNSWGVTMLSLEPEWLLVENLSHYLALGAQIIIVFFDDPDDPSIDAVAAMDRVMAVRCNADYWQHSRGGRPETVPRMISAIYENGVRFMRSLGIQWCLGIDVDELVYSTVPVTELLERYGSGNHILLLQTVESIHHRSMDPGRAFGSRYFKRWVNQPTTAQTRILRLVYGNEFEITRNGFFGQSAGKSFCRTAAPVEVYNCHRPYSNSRQLAVGHSPCACLLHFDAISPEHFKHKWTPRALGNTDHAGMSIARHEQTRRIKAALEESDDALRELFYRWHYLAWWKIALLRKAGLLVCIDPEQRIPGAGMRDTGS